MFPANRLSSFLELELDFTACLVPSPYLLALVCEQLDNRFPKLHSLVYLFCRRWNCKFLVTQKSEYRSEVVGWSNLDLIFFFPSIWLILFIVLVYLCGWSEIMLCHCISMNCFLLHAMGKLPLHLTFIVPLQLNHCHNKTNFNHLCKTVRSSQMRCSPIVFLDPFLNRPTIFKSIVTSKPHWVPNP